MSNLTSPAALAATGDPNVMSDVIDSLKRLERIGSESSKTVEKILQAAAELERTIASQYARSSGARISAFSILEKIRTKRNCSINEACESIGVDYKRIMNMEYRIEWKHSHDYSVRRGSSDLRVSENREMALAFASDIANGLLRLIECDLEMRSDEQKLALADLQNANESKTAEVTRDSDEI